MDKDSMIIYKVVNLISGKIYVGQDSNNSENYFGSGIAISSAIEKYGIKNFKKEILEHCNSKEQLNEREIYWIQKLNSKAPNGYNMTDGGEGGFTGYLSKKARQKISKSNKRLWKNLELKKIRCENISKANKRSWKNPSKKQIKAVKKHYREMGKLLKTEKQIEASRRNAKKMGIANRRQLQEVQL